MDCFISMHRFLKVFEAVPRFSELVVLLLLWIVCCAELEILQKIINLLTCVLTPAESAIIAGAAVKLKIALKTMRLWDVTKRYVDQVPVLIIKYVWHKNSATMCLIQASLYIVGEKKKMHYCFLKTTAADTP